MRRLVPLLTLPSLLVLAPGAPGQTNGAVLRKVGDPAPGGATVVGFTHLRVNDAGSWAAIVRTDDPMSPAQFWRDGSQVVAVGDPLPGGNTVSDIVDIDLDDSGGTASILEVNGTDRVLMRGGNRVLGEGEFVGLPGFSATARYMRLDKVNANADDEMVVRCVVRDLLAFTPIIPALIAFEVDGTGAILDQTVLNRAGDVLPSQSAELAQFGLVDNQLTFQDSGNGTWCGVLVPGATPGRHIAYLGGATPIFQGGHASPVPGRDYVDTPVLATAYADTGHWAISALVDTGNPANDGVIVIDGSVHAREGGNLTAFAGAPVIESLGERNLFLTTSMEPIFYVDAAGDPASDEAIVRGDTVVLREGQMLASGEVVSGLDDASFGFHASDSGEFVLAKAQVDGAAIALVYVQGEFGDAYCAAENNSTGGPSVTVAAGTSLVAANALVLVTSGGPPGSFGYYLSSQTPGNVLFPGGSSGRICLGGSIGRHIDGVGTIEPNGTFRYRVDLSVIPTSPNVAVMAGETWHHQFWHRDDGPTSNFSLPVRVTYH